MSRPVRNKTDARHAGTEDRCGCVAERTDLICLSIRPTNIMLWLKYLLHALALHFEVFGVMRGFGFLPCRFLTSHDFGKDLSQRFNCLFANLVMHNKPTTTHPHPTAFKQPYHRTRNFAVYPEPTTQIATPYSTTTTQCKTRTS